jgi:hypothetical protein
LRKLAHAKPASGSFQLRHQIKAGQGGVEFAPEAQPDLAFNPYSAGEQAQPQAQGLVVFFFSACLQIQHSRACAVM